MKVPSQRDNLISLCPGLEGTKPGLISSFLPSSSCPASSMVKAGPGTLEDPVSVPRLGRSDPAPSPG